jgi:hypothetical protein
MRVAAEKQRGQKFCARPVKPFGRSLKGEVKKKHNSDGWTFSCFAAHLFEQDLF